MIEPQRLTVALDLLDPHPLNSNRVPEELMKKLARNIRRTGLYPPLIVREKPGGRYGLIDGYHRKLILARLGYREANVEVWPVSDTEADIALATLNTLHGTDDDALRAALVESLMQQLPASDLAQMLPENEDDLEKMAKLARGEAAEPTPKNDDSDAPQPLAFKLFPDQYVTVRNAIEHIKSREALHERKNADGTALFFMAVEYLSGVGWDEGEAAKQEHEPPIGGS